MIPPRACLRSCSIGASSLFIPASQRRVRDNPDSCIWHGVTHGSFLFGHCQVCGDCQVCVLAGLPQGTLGSAGVRTSLNMTRGQSLPRFSGLLVFSLILRTLNFLLLTLEEESRGCTIFETRPFFYRTSPESQTPTTSTRQGSRKPHSGQ